MTSGHFQLKLLKVFFKKYLGNKKIKFKIKTKKNIKDLSFGFTGDKYATKISTERKGDFLVFEIPAAHKKHGYLTVYYLNEALISFKMDI